MPKYKYEIRYMLGPNQYDEEDVEAETWEGDDEKISFLRDGCAVFVIRTCHVVCIREVGIVEAPESVS